MTLTTAVSSLSLAGFFSDGAARVSRTSGAFESLRAAGTVTLDLDIRLVIQIVLFVLLFLVLRPLLFTPMIRLFEERERRIDGAKAEAKQMYAEADAKMAQYEAQLTQVKRTAGEERDRLRAQGQKREQEILARVRAETNALIDDGRAKIATDAAAIRVELEATSRTIAREIASRVLGREVT
jgi:F-type H+-transporting ATPase subunit b